MMSGLMNWSDSHPKGLSSFSRKISTALGRLTDRTGYPILKNGYVLFRAKMLKCVK